MTFKSIGIPKSQRFAARRKFVKSTFRSIEQLSVYFGALQSRFQFDSRMARRPNLTGSVVASISISRDRSGILQLYPIDRSVYSEDAVIEFENKILPLLKGWLASQLQKAETGVLGHEELIIEWSADRHLKHELQYL